MQHNDLVSVIEDLLEADMTKKESEEMEEATENSAHSKNRTADGEGKDSKTEKPSANTSSDTQGVLGKESGAAVDGGGDKDVGGSKGDNASDASADTQGIEGSESGAAIDAGGDKDVGGKKGDNASDASADTQGVEGKEKGQAIDAGGDKDVGKLKEEDESIDEDETEEDLTAKQKKLDIDNDGEIDGGDLAKVRQGAVSESDHEDDEEMMSEDDVPGSDEKTYKPEGDKSSSDTQGIEGSESGQAVDAGGDKDVGKLKEEDEENLEEGDSNQYGDKSSSDTQGILGKEKGQAIDAGGDEDEGAPDSKLKEEDESEDDTIEEAEEVDEDDDVDEGRYTPGSAKGRRTGGRVKRSTPVGFYAGAGDKKVRSEESDIDEDGEELEEEFKEKAAIIFETAVAEKANMIKEELQVEFDTKLQEEKDALNQKVSEFIDYTISEWLQDNALEIKYSLRTEIAENFIRGLKGLMEDNYIEIPEDEVSVVDELTETVESLKEQIAEQAEEIEEAAKTILTYTRDVAVEEISEDLTETQKIKLEKLAENVEAVDIEEFRYKLQALKESYFDGSYESQFDLSEEILTPSDDSMLEEDTTVNVYANFLGKTVK